MKALLISSLRAMLSRAAGPTDKRYLWKKRKNQSTLFMVTLLKVDDSQYYCWEEETLFLGFLKRIQRLYRICHNCSSMNQRLWKRLKGKCGKESMEYDCYYGRYRSRMNDANCDTIFIGFTDRLSKTLVS